MQPSRLDGAYTLYPRECDSFSSTRTTSSSLEVYVFPSLLVSCMEQPDDSGRITDGSRRGKKHVDVHLVS
jgi:hypothetical protein